MLPHSFSSVYGHVSLDRTVRALTQLTSSVKQEEREGREEEKGEEEGFSWGLNLSILAADVCEHIACFN